MLALSAVRAPPRQGPPIQTARGGCIENAKPWQSLSAQSVLPSLSSSMPLRQSVSGATVPPPFDAVVLLDVAPPADELVIVDPVEAVLPPPEPPVPLAAPPVLELPDGLAENSPPQAAAVAAATKKTKVKLARISLPNRAAQRAQLS